MTTVTQPITALQQQWQAIAIAWNAEYHGRGYTPGRNDLPSALYDCFMAGRFGDGETLNRDLLAVALEDAWTFSEFPALMLEIWDWEGFFEATGFIENGVRGKVPGTISTLYRASVRDVPGLSWTDDLEVAEWFHARNIEAGRDAVILKLENAPYNGTLARFHGEGSREESEWLLVSDCIDWATEID